AGCLAVLPAGLLRAVLLCPAPEAGSWPGVGAHRSVLHTGRAMVRLLRPVTAVLVLVAVLSACSAGKDAVDQNAGGQYRFVSAQKQGTTIKSADRKPTGTVTGTLLSG